MKKLFKYLCMLLCVLLGFAALRLADKLPADTGKYIEARYAGWSGVLQACVSSRWQPGGSFIRWLNRCADAFERTHDGVYIEFMECKEEHLGGIREIYTPDMIFYSPGVFSDADARAVCMGGYAWVLNPALPRQTDMPAIQPDSAALCYSAATISLLDGLSAEAELPGAGMDIGLSAAAARADALSRFINGEIPALAVSSADLARLIRLQDAGRGPEWEVQYSSGAFTDQLLFLSLPDAIPGDGRSEVIAEFAQFLLSEDCQAMLSDIGAIPVCGGSIYPAHSPYAAMEAALRQGKITAPGPFSEYYPADCADIVRSFISGERDAASAVSAILAERKVKQN